MTVEGLLKDCRFDTSVLRLSETILPEFASLNTCSQENTSQSRILSFLTDGEEYLSDSIDMEQLIDRMNANCGSRQSDVQDITLSSPVCTSIDDESNNHIPPVDGAVFGESSPLSYSQGSDRAFSFSPMNTLRNINRSTTRHRRSRRNLSSNPRLFSEQDIDLNTVETIQQNRHIEDSPSFSPNDVYHNADNQQGHTANPSIVGNTDGTIYLSITREQYIFSDNNPFAQDNVDEMFAEGLRRLAEHDIVNAVLCFEGVVRVDARHADAWFHLGKAQSQNEMDDQAINAFYKCIELTPERAEVYNLLAICYANENKIFDAVDALMQFLHFYEPSSHAVPALHNHLERRQLSLITLESIRDLQRKMIEIIDKLPAVDVSLEIALGTAYHLTGDIKNLINCMQKALCVMPNDENLWNRLGASFTNCGESESAIQAYRRALEISPGFIRARYNLALACLSLKATNEAIEHLLVALRIQHQSFDPDAKTSSNIWNLLKLIITIHCDDKSLLDACDVKDLDCLYKAFPSSEDNL